MNAPEMPSPTLQDVIDQLLAELAGYDGHSDEYGKMVAQLDKLYKMKALDNEHSIKQTELLNKSSETLRDTELQIAQHALKVREFDKPDRVDKNTLAIIAGNIAAVVLVISYERAHVVTTKALGFLMKR